MRVFAAAVSMIVLMVTLGSAAQQPRKPEDPAVTAARVRQEKIKTAEIEFQVSELYTKGSVSDGSPLSSNGRIAPPDDSTLESTNRLVIDGAKCRFESNHFLWHVQQEKFLRDASIYVADSKTAMMYSPDGLVSSGIPHGHIHRYLRNEGSFSLLAAPLLLAIRGVEPRINVFEVAEMVPGTDLMPISGANCVRYTIRHTGDYERIYWLDPDNEYVARRICGERNGKLSEQCDVIYRLDSACGCKVPESWTRKRFSDSGEVLSSFKASVISARFNSPQPDERFTLAFPGGTEVFDERNEKYFRVLEDGSMREVAPTGEPLTAETVAQPATPWYRRNQWLLLGLGAVFVLILAAYLTCRMRRIAR